MGDGEPTTAGGLSELMRRCKTGDVAALDTLYRRYVDRVGAHPRIVSLGSATIR